MEPPEPPLSKQLSPPYSHGAYSHVSLGQRCQRLEGQISCARGYQYPCVPGSARVPMIQEAAPRPHLVPTDRPKPSRAASGTHSRVTVLVACLHACYVASVVSDSVRPHGQQPTKLLCPRDSPGKITGVGCHFLLQCMPACYVASVVSDSL